MDKLKVLEETQISPPPGSVPPTSLPCTYFDIMYLGRPPVQFLFFYQSPQPKTILPDLKHSLSLALQHYFPLAGNLKWPPGSTKPELVYNDGDSVSFIVAESEFDFDELSNTPAQEPDVFLPLYARLSDPELVPLLAFQITYFPEKGICIGITFSHVAADGNTIFGFIKAWTSIYRSTKDFPVPVFDRSAILKGFEEHEPGLLNLLKEYNVSKDTFDTLINPGSVVPKGVMQASFTMTPNRIKRLKHWVYGSDRNQVVTPPLYVSSFSVTCAYLWVCFIKARWGQKGKTSPDATEHLLLPVDARTRWDSPLPSSYFGNCGVGLEVKAQRSELLGEQGIITAAKLIAKGIHGLDVYQELKKDTSYYPFLPPEQVLAIGSYPKFGAYGTDFGWGKPRKVEITSFDDFSVMFLNDSPNDEGGIEIGFVCKTMEYHPFASAFANSLGSHGALSTM